MDNLYERLAFALLGGPPGGALGAPPDFFGNPGLGIPGFTGIARPRQWDAVATATAPGIPVDEVHFVCLDDGTLVVDEDVPDGSLAPLAEAMERELARPYRAAAVRHEHDVWGVAAIKVAIAMLPADVGGDVIELSSYDGRVAVAIDGAPAHRPIPELTELGERREGPDFTLRAERLDETTWSVDVSPL